MKGRVPFKEANTQPQGRSGGGDPMLPGPATGRRLGNATPGGGINRATKSPRGQRGSMGKK